MNDLEFRTSAFAEPGCQDPVFIDKSNETPENRQLVDELKQLDQRICAALDIPVPEGLKERIRLQQTLEEHRRGQRRVRVWLSLAAGVLVMLTGLVFTHVSVHRQALPRELVDHVYSELPHLDDNFNYSTESANRVLKPFGMQLTAGIGHIRYLGKCDIDKKAGVHMVLQGEAGPVTVFMMPENRISRSVPVSDERFVGRIEPMQKGSVALIGEKGEPLDKLDRRLRNGLRWQF